MSHDAFRSQRMVPLAEAQPLPCSPRFPKCEQMFGTHVQYSTETRQEQCIGPLGQGYFLLSFPSILACFAGEFQGMFAVFAGFACKNSKHTPFVSARGAKRAKKEIALPLGRGV